MFWKPAQARWTLKGGDTKTESRCKHRINQNKLNNEAVMETWKMFCHCILPKGSIYKKTPWQQQDNTEK